MNCSNCGNTLNPGDTACKNCGAVVNGGQVQQPVQPTPVAPVQPTPVGPVQQPADKVVPVIPTPTNKSNKTLIIALISILIVGAIGFGVYTFLNKDEDKQEEKEDKKNNDKFESYEDQQERVTKNLKLKETIELYDGSTLFIYENKNNHLVGIDLELEYYDENDKFLGTSNSYAYAGPNKDLYVVVNKYSKKEGYKRYESKYTGSDFTNSMVYMDIKIPDIILNDTGKELIMQYKNKYEREIGTMDLCVVYSDNGKITGVQCEMKFDVKPNENANFEFDYSFNVEYNGLKFTNYEFIVVGYSEKEMD